MYLWNGTDLSISKIVLPKSIFHQAFFGRIDIYKSLDSQMRILYNDLIYVYIIYWRPITQIPLIGKILEKCVNTQLHCHLGNMAVLDKYQFGFRKNKSTSQAVFKIMTDLFKAIDN